MRTICFEAVAVLAMGVLVAIPAHAQKPAPIAPASAASQTAATPNWTTEQLIESTVHQAWLLSGKNEATFFEMVMQLADISAQNRGLKLPESEAAGQRMGVMIKAAAKADTNQLLYSVVDSAVRKVGKPA
ncbi:MAG: hypothetical protein PW792_17115 [Acidobacteriaceae bacterium]|nr:hypothetical protein [Acidobacteriaceae bacterium]